VQPAVDPNWPVDVGLVAEQAVVPIVPGVVEPNSLVVVANWPVDGLVDVPVAEVGEEEEPQIVDAGTGQAAAVAHDVVGCCP
jgi:hypothetical protein